MFRPKNWKTGVSRLIGAIVIAAMCFALPSISSSIASADESEDSNQGTSTTINGLEDLVGHVEPARIFPTQDPDFLWAINSDIRQQLADSVADGLAAAASQETARLDELASSASQTERDASASAFVDASPQAAREVLNRNFGDIIEAASSTPLDAIRNAGVSSFRGDQVATLEGADGQPAELAVSTTPMRVRGDDGKMAPIDLDLTFDDGSWTTKNGQVDLGIPASSAGTVDVGPISFDVTVPDAQTSNSTSLGKSARFYPEIGPDTDMVVASTSEGAEVFFSLRSPSSPEQQSLRMDIPAGARLAETSAGAFEIVRGTMVIARIPVPVAFDSDGTPVPVEASVDGGTLTLSTEHRGEDLAYPILVDPIIDTIGSGTPTVRRFSEVVDSEGNLVMPYGGWYAVDDGGSLDNYAGSGAFGDGLYLDSPVASTPRGGVWIWVAPPGSAELTQVDFGPYGLALNGDTSSAGGAMILGTQTEEGQAGEVYAEDVSNGYTTVYTADGEGYPSANDFAFFGLLRIKFGSVVGDNDHSAFLGGAVARLSDPAGARLTGDLGEMGSETIDAGWTNSSDTMTIPMEATDSGLGVKKLEAVAVDQDDEAVVLGSYVDPCLGGAGSPCPETLAHDVDLDMSLVDDGIHTVKFRAYDPLDQTAGGPNLQVGIDRTGPLLSATGSIVDADGTDDPYSEYSLAVEVPDGSYLSPQSGMASLAVKIDDRIAESQAQECPEGSCESALLWDVPAEGLEPGPHEVQIIATDQVGNQTTSSYEFVVPSDNQNPVVVVDSELTNAPPGGFERRPYELEVETTDVGFGMRTISIMVDDAITHVKQESCQTNSCAMATSTQIDLGDLSGGTHQVKVAAEDGAGNVEVQSFDFEVPLNNPPPPPPIAFSGELIEAEGGWIERGDYLLSMQAQESTIWEEKVQLFVDEELLVEADICSTVCVSEHDLSVDLSGVDVGEHTIRVVGTSGTNVRSEASFKVYVTDPGALESPEAAEILSEAAPDLALAVEPSQEQTLAGIDPSVVLEDDVYMTENTVVPTMIKANPQDGFTVEQMDGSTVTVEPAIEPVGTSPPEVSDDVSVVFGTTQTSVDTVTKPVYDGILNFQQIRSVAAPETYSWDVSVAGDQVLVPASERLIEVHYPSGRSALSITAPDVVDAAGRPVESTLSVSGDTVSLDVDHGVGAVYPIAAGIAWQAGYRLVEPIPQFFIPDLPTGQAVDSAPDSQSFMVSQSVDYAPQPESYMISQVVDSTFESQPFMTITVDPPVPDEGAVVSTRRDRAYRATAKAVAQICAAYGGCGRWRVKMAARWKVMTPVAQRPGGIPKPTKAWVGSDSGVACYATNEKGANVDILGKGFGARKVALARRNESLLAFCRMKVTAQIYHPGGSIGGTPHTSVWGMKLYPSASAKPFG